MKKFNLHLMSLLVLFLASLFVACDSQQKEEMAEIKIEKSSYSKVLSFAVNETIGQVVGDGAELTVSKDQVRKVMESNYKDDTQIDDIYVAKEEGEYYLYGKGFNSKKESRIIRYKLRVDGNGGVKTINGGTDSCSGVNCSYCVFEAGSGCDCRRAGDPWDGGASYCNHSTSTGAAGVHLLDATFSAAGVDGEGQIVGEVSSSQVDPELLAQLSNGEDFVLENDYILPAEAVQQIYGNSGQTPPFEGDLTVPAGQYQTDTVASAIVIVIVTDDTIIIIVIND